jgi:hypothetical protein
VGRLASDLGEWIVRESKGGNGRIHRHGESSGGNAFSCSSLSAWNLVGRLRREKMTMDASQCSLRFITSWACWSRPRHQSDRNTVASDV